MKNSFKYIVLVSLFLLFGAVTTIIFLTVPDARLESSVFWIAWSFAIPFNFICATCLHLWACKKGEKELIRIPLAYYLVGIFGVIYLGVGFTFMYLPVVKPVFLIIIELVVTVAYIIIAMYFLFAANYISKSEQHTKEKVAFIKFLMADVQDCATKATDADVKKALDNFAQNIRFSDPMSHASLSVIEQQISATVFDISQKLGTAEKEEILNLIKQGEVQLDSRNKRCLILK